MGVILHKKQNYSGVSPYKYVPITTANYNALPQSEKMDSTKVYFLIDAKVASARIDDTDTSTGKVWSSKKVSDEIDAVQDQVDDNTADITTLNSNLFKELWSNPSPNSNFNAQTVLLNDGNYSLFLIVANRMTGETRQISTICDGNGYLTYTGCGSGGVVAFARGFDKTDSTHIAFGTAQYAVGATSAQADPSRIIPVKIYGIK